MIKLIAEKYVNEENKKEFLKIVEELISESKKESGCISYGIYEDLTNPEHFSFIEEWVDEDAIEEHRKTKHYKELGPILAPLCYKHIKSVNYKAMVL